MDPPLSSSRACLHTAFIPFSVHCVCGWRLLGGINGQVPPSALGSGCACPTAFIAFRPRWRIQCIQVLWRVPALTFPEWLGYGRQDSTGSGVHAGQWSLLHQVLYLLAPSWPSWLRPVGGGGGGGYDARMYCCLELAAPIGLSPLKGWAVVRFVRDC